MPDTPVAANASAQVRTVGPVSGAPLASVFVGDATHPAVTITMQAQANNHRSMTETSSAARRTRQESAAPILYRDHLSVSATPGITICWFRPSGFEMKIPPRVE